MRGLHSGNNIYKILCLIALIVYVSGCSKGKKDTIVQVSAKKMVSLSEQEKVATIIPKGNEIADFYKFYYLDNKGRLNTFFWKHKQGFYSYISCMLYRTNSDGTIKDTKITWDSKAAKIMELTTKNNNFSIMAQWMDEKNGDFYVIVCHWSSESDDNSAILYGIHSNGKLFLQLKVEDYLEMDKIDPKTYACGFTIDYLGQKDGVAYFSYKDNSKNAVVYYDMNHSIFSKQIFTNYEVKGIIKKQYIGINGKQLIIGNIPKGKRNTNDRENSLLIGQSDIINIYDLPEYKGISVSRDSVYMLTQDYYEKIQLDNGTWEVLADVSNITKKIKADLYLNDFIAMDDYSFALRLYADCGTGYYIDVYQIK